MSSPQANLAEWFRASWALTALAVAAERGILSALAEAPRTVSELAARASLQPATVRAIADVLAAGGFVERDDESVRASAAFSPMLAGRGSEFLAADLRATLGLQTATTARAREAAAELEGWPGEDSLVVRAQGLLSEQSTSGMKKFLESIPALDAALSGDNARFLDVGTGAAGLCVALARMYPRVHIVGIEPSPIALEEARRVVADSGVGDRIELRHALGQALADEQAFDCAYIAQMFIPDGAVDLVFRAVHRALRPGGFLFTGAAAHRGADLANAVSRWRSAVWGGGAERDADALAAIFERAGFAELQRYPLTPGASLVPFVARRL